MKGSNAVKMRKKDNGKGLLLVLLCILAGAGVFAGLLRMEEKRLSDYRTKMVVTAIQDIPEGTRIKVSELEMYFQETEINEKNAVEGFETLEDICNWASGKGEVMTCTGIKRNEQLYSERLLSVASYARQYEQPVEAGVKVSSYEYCVGGTLRAGDVVDVISINADNQSDILLENVIILQAFDSNGIEIMPDRSEAVSTGFNIMIEKGELEKYNNALENGTIRLIKKYGA